MKQPDTIDKPASHQALHKLFIVIFYVATLTACASQPAKSVDARGNQTHSAFTLLGTADTAYSKGAWIEAAHAYEKLTAQVPNDAYAWLRLGNVRVQQGRLQAAVEAYEACLVRDPQLGKAHYNLATVYLMQAQSALRQAGAHILAHDPGKKLVADRLRQLDTLLYQTVAETTVAETVSPATDLNTNAGVAPLLASTPKYQHQTRERPGLQQPVDDARPVQQPVTSAPSPVRSKPVNER